MQGFNKYYPPDYDPSKHSSLNSYRGTHALGDRARKLKDGILIARFELPFNIWCGGCEAHIGMGVRYNAEKKKVGMYYSTPIYSFRCKCHLCDHWFEIRTDPQNTRYVVHEGARQKNETWDPSENGGFAPIDMSEDRHPVDAFQSLEKKVEDKRVAMGNRERLERLEDLNEGTWDDPYELNRKLRRVFREVKKEEAGRESERKEVKDKFGLGEHVVIEGARERWDKRLGVGIDGEEKTTEEEEKEKKKRDEEENREWRRLREEKERNREVELELGTGKGFRSSTSSRTLTGKRKRHSDPIESAREKRKRPSSTSVVPTVSSLSSSSLLSTAKNSRTTKPSSSFFEPTASRLRTTSSTPKVVDVQDVVQRKKELKKAQSLKELRDRLVRNTEKRKDVFGVP